ncbi:zona pellucida sperm-binding protein 1 [Pseudonaja textilis]|uniref:zona pellucida sperm-binding protein 1 n=1 Tax=Pseudonaja textilis TaxID=8673 RepID=UPI000EA8C520|nr:zona pellucida sperm-binding protein 1 [Pseudonaja textilis]
MGWGCSGSLGLVILVILGLCHGQADFWKAGTEAIQYLYRCGDHGLQLLVYPSPSQAVRFKVVDEFGKVFEVSNCPFCHHVITSHNRTVAFSAGYDGCGVIKKDGIHHLKVHLEELTRNGRVVAVHEINMICPKPQEHVTTPENNMRRVNQPQPVLVHTGGSQLGLVHHGQSRPGLLLPHQPSRVHPGQSQTGQLLPLQPGQPGLVHPGESQPGLLRPIQPGQVRPGESQPGLLRPIQLGQVRPGESQPGLLRPIQPGQVRPGESQPGLMRPIQPGQVGPGESQPGLVHPIQPGQVRPGESHPSLLRPIQTGQVRPGESQPGLVRPGESQPGLLRPIQPGKVRPGESHPSLLRPIQPGQVSPGESHPGLVRPGESQPGLLRPIQPGQVRPGESQPSLRHPGESQPGLLRPGQPGQVHPGESQPGLLHPGESQPGLLRPIQLGQVRPGESHPGLVRPGESQPGLLRPIQPGQVRPGESQPGLVRPGESQPSLLRPIQPGQVRPGESQPGLLHPIQPGQVHSGESQPGLVRPIQPGQVKPEEFQPSLLRPIQPGQVHPGESQPGLVRPGESQPGLMHPIQPGQVQPGESQPGLARPLQPGHVHPLQPGLVHPVVSQPGLVHPGQLQPGLVYPGESQPGQLLPLQPDHVHPGEPFPGPVHPMVIQSSLGRPLTQQQCQVFSGRIPCAEVQGPTACHQTGCCYDARDQVTPCYYGNTVTVQCLRDGYFILVISRDMLDYPIILESVRLSYAQADCSPIRKTESFLVFRFPLTQCGTTVQVTGGKLIYENQLVSGLDILKGPDGSITRDSTLMLHARCIYNTTDFLPLQVEVFSPPSPAPIFQVGPLRLELRIATDSSYTSYYSQYPIVKILRDPVHVEIRILQRDDPSLVLVLNECWATPSSNPLEQLQWPILVDGCPFEGDNYRTQLVPMGPATSELHFPNHYQRFIIYTFTFVDSAPQMVLDGLVYLFCSVSVCHPADHDSCRVECQMPVASRGRRFLKEENETESLDLVSTYGAVIFQESIHEKQVEWKNDVISSEDLTLVLLVVLPIIGIILFIAVLVLWKKRSRMTKL